MIKSQNKGGDVSVAIGIIFSKLGLSPNDWTALSLVPAIFGFVSLVYGHLLLAAGLFILSGLFDAIDGAVARVTGSATNLGAFLDGIVDRYVEMFLYMGLLVFVMASQIVEFLIPHYYWFAILISGALLPTFVRAYADHRGVVTEAEDHRRMGGILERAERLGLIFAGMILGYFNTAFLIYMVAVTGVLSHVTAIQRIAYVVEVAHRKGRA